MNRTFIFFILLLLSTPIVSMAQKIYVYCPAPIELKNNDGKLKGNKINLIINDLRNIKDEGKIECTTDEIKNTLAETVIASYPSAIINYLEEKPEVQAGYTNVTINITAYHSASGTNASDAIATSEDDFSWGALPSNRWNSVSGFHVIIEQSKDGGIKKQSRNIANIVSRPNLGGAITSKKALNEAYSEARTELLFFIENNINN